LAAQGHLPNDFLLAGDLSLAFGDVSISFRNVVTLDVCLRQSSSASRRNRWRVRAPSLIRQALNAGNPSRFPMQVAVIITVWLPRV
jgi:hypothetical protein